jgi:predicted nucleotidyltransferase
MKTLRERRAAYVTRLEEALDHAVAQLRAIPGVQRISVFGSYARGRRDLFTDLDILVILDTADAIPERLARLYRQVDVPVDLDLVAWTPAEYERMRMRPFGRKITAEERVIYEAGSDR